MHQLMYIDVQCGDFKCRAMIDSGATHNSINTKPLRNGS